ncbi:MAG: hypothetical protein KDC34_06380 [Saprospiraceae bacterium]|nr:hypothetical protein [Saprospiraceae bacterium]
MNRKLLFISAFIVICLAPQCTIDQLDDPLDQKLRTTLNKVSPDNDYTHYILPESHNLADIPQDEVNNPLTAVKIELGKMLFFETGLALAPIHEEGRESYSCGTCHVPSACFMPGREQGVADGGFRFGENGEGREILSVYNEDELDAQGVRPLAMINLAYVPNTTWNGRFGPGGVNTGTEYAWGEGLEVNFLGYGGLETQNIEGLRLHRMVVNKDVVDSLGYKQYFDASFPEMDEETRYSEVGASFAISAYLRSILTNKAPFQQWLKGNDEAMTDPQKRGALLFYGKALCYRCHKGPALNSVEFYSVGVKDLYETGNAHATSIDDPRNLGRGSFTGNPEDNHKFKVPQLYNMGDVAFFFHGASQSNLHDVVNYFNDAIPENPNIPEEQIAVQFHPLYLTHEEVEDVVEFLKGGLYDPDLDRYVPDAILSGNCFPNNDPASREDLGCD